MEYERLFMETSKPNKDYVFELFHGTDKKYSLICQKFKAIIIKLLET